MGEICVLMGHCSGCPLYEVIVEDPFNSLGKLSLFFSMLGWWFWFAMYLYSLFLLHLKVQCCGSATCWSVYHGEIVDCLFLCRIWWREISSHINIWILHYFCAACYVSSLANISADAVTRWVTWLQQRR